MKKLGKVALIISCFVLMLTAFTACSFGGKDNSSDNDTTPSTPSKPQQVELSLSGYNEEITVGDELYSKLKVQKKVGENWEEVVKADYTISTDYDKTAYGTFTLTVTLKDGTGETSVDIKVKPLKVKLPTYTTVYTGELVDVKTALEKNSTPVGTFVKLYDVTTYENKTNVGVYTAKVKLTNPKKYVWVDVDGTELKGATQVVNWSITLAPRKTTYNNSLNLTVYYGDTLRQVVEDNKLNYDNHNLIDFAFISETGEQLDEMTLITNQIRLYAKFRPNANYEYNENLVFNVTVVTTAEYKVEHYKKQGDTYVLADTETLSGQITSVVSATAKMYEGFTLNDTLSDKVGRITKDGLLVIKMYYDN